MGYPQIPAAREAFLLSHGDARKARLEPGGGWDGPLVAGASAVSPPPRSPSRGERRGKPRGNGAPPPGQFARCSSGAPALPRHPRAPRIRSAAGAAVRGRGERQTWRALPVRLSVRRGVFFAC